ncbi:MAG: transport-associated protein [Hirschia sp.]|nr:transport-associated protein [Hirschia sp.]MBF18842.1 transport-associated protein [Hirschia sp.]
MNSHRLLALVLIACAPIAGCAVVQEKTIGQSLDDASSSSQVKARLLASSTKTFNEVDVEVTNRLVLLTGRVPTQQDRIEAERIAWSVNTLDEVANEIEVIDQSSVLTNVNDEWITARVRSRLLSDPDIKGVNYNIETFNGAVYLLGTALSEQELQAAATHASVVKGVKKVVSYVVVRDRNPPNFANLEAAADQPYSYGGYSAEPAPIRPVSQPHIDPQQSVYSDPYADPYADAYGESLESNPYADDEYNDLIGGK